MRMRSLLTSVAAAAIIAATTATFTSGALAQKSAMLNPKTGWAVTNIANDASGSGAYCAMARRFADNLILTMAKNQQSETSFALDFPKGNFDTKQSFDVVLDPGAGQQRNYQVHPASKSAFVVRLGHDRPFFQALEKTGSLRAEIDGETYNFNLADIDKGQGKLDSCLAEAMAPKAPQHASGSITPFPREDGGVTEKIASLEAENRDLRAQVSVEQGGGPVDLGSSRHEVESLRKENMALNERMQASQAGGHIDPQVQQELKRLQHENDKLSAIVSASTSSDGSAAGILQGLAAENQRLQASLNERQVAAPEGDIKEDSASQQAMDDLTERLRALEEENLRLSHEAKEAREVSLTTARDPGDEARMQVIKEENAELQARLTLMERLRGGNESGKVAVLESSVKRLKSKNDVLKEQVSALTVALGSGGQSSSRLSDLKSKNDILARQVDALTTVLGSGGNRNNTQLVALKKQVSDLESVNELLQDSLANIQPAAGDDGQIEELKAANDTLQANLDVEKTLKDSHKVTMGHLEARLGTLKDQNDALKGEIKTAREEARELDRSLDKVKIEKMALQQKADKATLSEYELAELQTKLDGLTKEKITLVAELDVIRASNREADEGHEKEIKALKKDNESIQAALDAAKEDVGKEAEKFETASIEAEAEIESLKTENETLKVEVLKAVEMSEDGQVQRAQIKTLISENERLAKDVAVREIELQQEIVSLNEVVQNLQQENESLNDGAITSATNSTIALKRLNEENGKLLAELAIKSKYDENAKDTVMALGAQIDELQAANETLTVSLANLTEEADSYPALIQEQQVEITALKEENGKLQQEVANLREGVTANLASAEDHSKIIEENGKLQQEVANLREGVTANLASAEDHSKIIEENRQLKDRLKSFIQKASFEKAEAIKGLTKENSRLRDQLHKMSARNKVVPVSYRAPAKPKQKPVRLLEVSDQRSQDKVSENKDLPPPEDILQNISPAAGQPEMDEDVQDRAPYQPHMNEAQREEANMKKALANPKPIEPIVTKAPEVPQPTKPEYDLYKPFEPAVEPTVKPIAEPEQSSKARGASLSIQDMLRNASVNLTGAVEIVEEASKDGITAYQWRADNLYGSAEQREMTNSSDFDRFAKQYLERMESRCPGDFAALTDGPTRQGGMRMDSYEVACIGSGVNSSATLLFFEADGTFTVVAHEADTANMSVAMEVRDRLIKAIAGTPI